MGDRNEKYRTKAIEVVSPHCDESVEEVGFFQPKGMTGAAGLTMGVSGLAGSLMRRKAKKDAGLPEFLLVALTPSNVHVFGYKPRGTSWKIKEEAARWPRAGLRVERGEGTMTKQLTMTLEDGQTVSLESIKMWGSFNDPIIEALTGAS